MFSAPGLDPVLGETEPTFDVVKADLFLLGFLVPICTSGALSGASIGFLGAAASRGGGAGTGGGGAGTGFTDGADGPPPKHISLSPKFFWLTTPRPSVDRLGT
jgi:hypothetical protein